MLISNKIPPKFIPEGPIDNKLALVQIMAWRRRDDKLNHLWPGGWFNIKMLSHQYRKSHCGDKTILRPSYLHNGISYSGMKTFLYWIMALVFGRIYALLGLEGWATTPQHRLSLTQRRGDIIFSLNRGCNWVVVHQNDHFRRCSKVASSSTMHAHCTTENDI